MIRTGDTSFPPVGSQPSTKKFLKGSMASKSPDSRLSVSKPDPLANINGGRVRPETSVSPI